MRSLCVLPVSFVRRCQNIPNISCSTVLVLKSVLASWSWEKVRSLFWLGEMNRWYFTERKVIDVSHKWIFEGMLCTPSLSHVLNGEAFKNIPIRQTQSNKYTSYWLVYFFLFFIFLVTNCIYPVNTASMMTKTKLLHFVPKHPSQKYQIHWEDMRKHQHGHMMDHSVVPCV